jgi:CheY-like chemotaxis protein
MAGDREKYLASGFNDYITKPIVDETILLGAIEKWLKASKEGKL